VPRDWEADKAVVARLLGGRLREARLDAELALPEAARRSGVSSSYISECERGEKIPSLRILLDLCDCYGLLVADLLGDVYPFGTRRRPLREPQAPRDHRRRPD
jgi:transcriptional regulator with XRE-family HTH domain